jgi:serpin B
MWMDSTLHKTYIKVDEEGTEAAAVTALGMAGSALPPEPVKVTFNKPFTFVIKDNQNGEILFMGEYAFAE